MGEREPREETIGKGELFFLTHPGNETIFSGYGLTIQPDRKGYLAGLLMVDRPKPADPEWLKQVEDTFGEYQLVPMTATGMRGILCRMEIEPDSIPYLQQHSFEKSYLIQKALQPLLEELLKPIFRLGWDDEQNLWKSELQQPNELPEELKDVLRKTGYGCLAMESDSGVVHVCHAPDRDIVGFSDKPIISRWQMIKMPSAPVIRLELIIFYNSKNPFRFESFLNVGEEGQAKILSQLANQDHLYLAFYGDDLSYQYGISIPHDVQHWQLLDELTEEAHRYWDSITPQDRDFDQAKASYMHYF